MRLIDADALIHELNNSHYPGAPYVDAGISIAIGKICDAPTIEERKTGRWISGDKMRDYPRVPYRAWKTYCSECGEEALLDMDCSDYVLTPHCPNCGCRMMEVEHENR